MYLYINKEKNKYKDIDDENGDFLTTKDKITYFR